MCLNVFIQFKRRRYETSVFLVNRLGLCCFDKTTLAVLIAKVSLSLIDHTYMDVHTHIYKRIQVVLLQVMVAIVIVNY